ncbi:MAG: hypothetical protein R6V01_05200 [Thermoplasmatota archaeon]
MPEYLSETERAVILGLIRNPEHKDKEISEAMDMSIFTFNKVKNNLLREGALDRFYVPNYGKIGFGILAVSHGSGLGAFMDQDRTSRFDKGVEDQIIFGIFEGDNGLAFHLLEDYRDLKDTMRIKEKVLDTVGLDEGALEHVLIPTKDLHVERFFDIESLLTEDLGERAAPYLEAKTPAQLAASVSWSDFFQTSQPTEELDDESSSTLLELVRSGGTGEGELLERLDISRYRFHRIKERLLEDGYIKPFYATDIMRLGLNVMIFTHLRLKPGQDPHELFERYKDKMPSNLMIVAFDRADVIGLGVFKDLPAGSDIQMRMRRSMMEHGFLKKEPVIRIFSLPNIRKKETLTFHRPLKRLMGTR